MFEQVMIEIFPPLNNYLKKAEKKVDNKYNIKTFREIIYHSIKCYFA